MVVVHTVSDEMSCTGSTAHSSQIETDYDVECSHHLVDVVTQLRQSLTDQNTRMIKLEQQNSKTTAHLIEAVTSLS